MSNKCQLNCTCGRHSNTENSLIGLEAGRKPCRSNCSCLRHLPTIHSSITRAKISAARKGKSTRGSGWSHSAETIKKMRLNHRGGGGRPCLQGCTCGRHKPTIHTDETKEKCRQARLKQILPKKGTYIELLLRNEFSKRGLKFETNKTMFGRNQPDFVFEGAQLIVEADGYPWHSTKEAHKRHEKFYCLAHKHGYEVWRFPGHLIISQTRLIGRLVKTYINDRLHENE